MKRVGIWGFGIVGRSAVNYFLSKNYIVSVYDFQKLSDENLQFLQQNNIKHYPTRDLFGFLENNSEIIPSPGIDLQQYKKYFNKFSFELDIFQKNNKKFCIGLTGSVGKTTIINTLSDIMKSIGIKVWTGGNIGTGMLDFLAVQNEYDLCLLELSSFQLEHCKTFAPNISIITNIYENHLDRHKTLKNYKQAKMNICKQQTKKHYALLPHQLIDEKNNLKSSVAFFSNDEKVNEKFAWLLNHTFKKNVILIQNFFNLLKKALPKFESKVDSIKPIALTGLPHRLQFIKTINGIDFYNDSKSTTTASTLAAIEKLKERPILLILGGLSKGIDRKPFIKQLKNKVKKVYIFGKEKKQLQKFCDKHNVFAESFDCLENIINQCLLEGEKNDQVLFSPSGSSFDLFKDYEKRGQFFIQLIINSEK